MAKVRPFIAIVPAHEPGQDVSSRTAPPYDVINAQARERFASVDSHNVVALELPEGPLDPAEPGNRYETGARVWSEWLEEGVLVSDGSPAIYVIEQRYERGGRSIRRKAFIASVDLEPFDAGIVVPHEHTLPKALDDRLNLTRSTRANLSQVLGLFEDAEGETGAHFDTATASAPDMLAVDAEGVESRVWAIRDDESLAALDSFFGSRKIYIADGHHRYTTALAYRDERRREAGGGPYRAYDGVMMALVNMDDPELLVLPTHRVASAAGPFEPSAFRRSLETHFDVSHLDGEPENVLGGANKPAFVIRTPADGFVCVASLREDVDPTQVIKGSFSDAWKSLDVSILQELILAPHFGIRAEDRDSLERLAFVKSDSEALSRDDADAVFLMRPTRMEQLRAVAGSGEIMPQKSTYFYPKLLSGLLYRSLDD